MPKKRKTREQKILTEQKRLAVHETAPSTVSSQKNEKQQAIIQGATFSLPSITPDNKSIPSKTRPTATTIAISTSDYNYLGTDLLKTAIVTIAIALTEIIIRILFRG